MRSLLHLSAALALTLVACQDSSSPTTPDQASDRSGGRPPRNPAGAVYVQTNAASGNEVVAYRRGASGRLDFLGTFATGGEGTGIPRLGSQGSLILSDDNRWLLVTNVGSNEVSVFAVTPRGLHLTDKVPSGGRMPFSLTLRGDLLYVLNAGGRAGDRDNITAFTLSGAGKLAAIPRSTRRLSAANTDPAQVQFSPDGGTLVVTEKATDRIDTYAVGADGRASRRPTVDKSHGDTPFGFAFTSSGYFVVTEAFDKAAGRAAASSYRLDGSTGIEVVSGTVRNGETDVCWTVITRDGKYAYITNFGSGTVSSYRIAGNGKLTLLEAVAGRTARAQGPRDQDFARDGRYLYVIDVGFANAATRAINAFRVKPDGSLKKIGTFPLPAFPAVAGLAAY